MDEVTETENTVIQISYDSGSIDTDGDGSSEYL
jgi:hypothetical protein